MPFSRLFPGLILLFVLLFVLFLILLVLLILLVFPQLSSEPFHHLLVNLGPRLMKSKGLLVLLLVLPLLPRLRLQLSSAKGYEAIRRSSLSRIRCYKGYNHL